MDYLVTCTPCLIKAVPKKLEYNSETILYAFDLDGTIISTKSGNTHAKNNADWKWLENPNGDEKEFKNMFFLLIDILTKNKNSKLVIFTNQGGIKPFSKGYLKNNRNAKEKAQAHHLEIRFKEFLFKIHSILKCFYKYLNEERVLLYASIKTPAVLAKPNNVKGSQKSKLQLNKIFKVKSLANQNVAEKMVNESILNNLVTEYFHDIPEHVLVIDSLKKIEVIFSQYDQLSKEKLETKLKSLSYRKPNVGMLHELYKDLEYLVSNKNIKFYVGDAAGRPGDFSDSDKLFAENGKLLFKTPDQILAEYKIS